MTNEDYLVWLREEKKNNRHKFEVECLTDVERRECLIFSIAYGRALDKFEDVLKEERQWRVIEEARACLKKKRELTFRLIDEAIQRGDRDGEHFFGGEMSAICEVLYILDAVEETERRGGEGTKND